METQGWWIVKSKIHQHAETPPPLENPHLRPCKWFSLLKIHTWDLVNDFIFRDKWNTVKLDFQIGPKLSKTQDVFGENTMWHLGWDKSKECYCINLACRPSKVTTDILNWRETLQIEPFQNNLLSRQWLSFSTTHACRYDVHEREVGELALQMGFDQVSLSSTIMAMVRIVPRGYTGKVWSAVWWYLAMFSSTIYVSNLIFEIPRWPKI